MFTHGCLGNYGCFSTFWPFKIIAAGSNSLTESSFRANIMPYLSLGKRMIWPRMTFLLMSLCVFISNRFCGFEFFKFILKLASLCESKVNSLQFRADDLHFYDSHLELPFVFIQSLWVNTCLLPGDKEIFVDLSLP